MKNINNVLICGIGAIGSIYADKIQKFNPNSLRVLVDENRLKRYNKNPVVFNGVELNLKYILPEDNNFKADLIIIATKYDGLFEAVKNIRNFVHENTIILSLLNGVTSENIIADLYGRDKVLYSYFIGHSTVRTGRYVSHDDVNKIVFGSEGAINNNVQSVMKYFKLVGINYEVPSDIRRALWSKYMLNISSNQTSAILGMSFGEMYNNERCLAFMKKLMKEVELIAKAEGISNTETMIDEVIEQIKMISPEGRTSMLQDVEAGRKTELEMFAGTVVELGKKHDIPTPYNQVIKNIIEIIHENQNNELNSKPQAGIIEVYS